MNLRRSLGVKLLDVDSDELDRLEPDLRGRFRFGLLGPSSPPAARSRAATPCCW
jgi:D-amino-acid dehydrogenase